MMLTNLSLQLLSEFASVTLHNTWFIVYAEDVLHSTAINSYYHKIARAHLHHPTRGIKRGTPYSRLVAAVTRQRT